MVGNVRAPLNPGNHQEHWMAGQKTPMELQHELGQRVWKLPCTEYCWGRCRTKVHSMSASLEPWLYRKWVLRGTEARAEQRGLSVAACDQQQSSSCTCEMDAEKAVPFVAQCQD